MAAKTSDTVLRVSAKNLASKELREVSGDLDRIADSQKKNATASGLASRALRELTDEQKALATVAAELNRRGGIAGNLVKARTDVAATAGKVRELKAELNELLRIKASGAFVGNIDKAVLNVEKSLRRANTQLEQQTTRFQKVEAAASRIGISSNNAAESIAKINGEAKRTEQLMQQAAGAVERYDAALIESKASLTAQDALQRDITAEAQRRNAIEAAAAAQRRQEATALSAQIREQARIRDELTKRFQAKPLPAASPVLGPAGDLGAQAAAREAAFRERLVNVLRRQRDGGEKLLQMDGQLEAKTRTLTRALQEQGNSLDRTNKLGGIFNDTGRKSLSVYQRLRGQILSTIAAYAGLYQAVHLVMSAVTVQQERKRIVTQLGIANAGDVNAAARDVTFLREQADRLGLVYEDLAKNYANYKIAAKSVGASNNTIKKSFIDAAEIVTGLGLSTEDAEGVYRAFVQILGKARVQAEELRGQLGDRLPGAVAAFAKSLVDAGKIKSFSELDAYLKKGKAGVAEFFKFVEDYAKTTRGAVDAQSQTLFANFNRLKNAYRDFLEEFAKKGVTSGLSEVVTELIAKLKGQEGTKFATELAEAFKGVVTVLTFVIEHFDALVKVVKFFIALNLGKAVVGLSVPFLTAAANIVAWTAKVNTARVAGETFATAIGAGGLIGTLGALGIALGIAAAAWYRYTKATNEAISRNVEALGTFKRLQGARGADAISQVNEATKQVRDLTAKRNAFQAELDKANKRLPLVDAANNLQDQLLGTETGSKVLKSRVDALNANIRTIISGQRIAIREAFRYEDEVKKLDAQDAAQQDHFVDATPADKDTSASDAKKREAKLRAEELLAERRKDIEDKAAEAILDIDKQLAEAQIETNIASQEQIEANYQATIRKIGDEIAKKKSDLEGLKRDALNLKDTTAASSAQAAIDKLPALQKELELKAHIAAVTASIKLQEDAINASISERDSRIEAINTKVQLGLIDEVEGRQQAIDLQEQYRQKIVDAIVALQAQLEALKVSDPNLAAALHVDELISKLETSKVKTGELQSTVELIGKNLGGQFSQGVAAAFGTFVKGATGGIEGVNGIGAAFQNARRGFMEFLADFLVGIGQAILQAILLKAIMNAIKGTSGGYADAAIGALTGHTGGVVGQSSIGSGNPVRQVSAAYFAGAQRFHGGGLPGLSRDEVPAILRRKEEVLTESDPRNVLNGGLSMGGGGGRPRVDVAIHNNIDSGDMVVAGLATRPGQKSILNTIGANKAQIKKLLDIG